MKRFFGICLSCLILSLQFASAQEKKIVSGHITNSSDSNKPLSDVMIFAYNTVAEAEDAYKSLVDARASNGVFNPGYVIESFPDLGGYYEVLVPETGALLFYTGIADPVLEKVNYRMEINVAFALNIMLESSKVTAGVTDRMLREPPVMRGGRTVFPVAYRFPAQDYGKNNVRLVKQSSLIDASQEPARISYFPPTVHDGRQYHRTQLRRKNYDGSNDPLYPIAGENTVLTDTLDIISWIDTIPASYTEGRNYLKWKIWAEDYLRVVYADSGLFRTDRITRPMQFLEYPRDAYILDPARFRKNPRRERRDIAGNISLSFIIGQARLNPDDASNKYSLEKLKRELTEAITDEGSSLKEFHIEGVASPDGLYDRNVDLAKRRMDFALNQVISILPKNIRDRVYMTTKASVAPWTAVADILERDSFAEEAAAVRTVVARYPDRKDRQFYEIKKLPFYSGTIVPRLPELRTVSYSFVTEVYRELTPEEIFSSYSMDRRRGVEREYALYEYWHLFNMVTDQAELARLYRQAYDVSLKVETKPWVLPANNLTVAEIENGNADTTMLSSFIDMRFPCNYVIRDMNRKTEELVNPAEVVANMTVMMLMQKQYARADELASMLPDSYMVLKAAAWCLAGRFDDTSAEGREYYMLMRDYSPRNKVVMNLANGNISLAKAALRELPQDDPVTKYLSLQIMCYGLSDAYASMDIETYEKALDDLLYCFNADPEFIDIAERDYMVCEDLYKEAKKLYDNK
ncbi:MAG: hypothetical protein NC308_06975 [Clostridium sp.]|nr:hypothetical protein [Bacteroides sp.]MCM1198614.1 hypothetical protein [Clostridium sp.]